ncbi:hypothetical protein Dda_6387 [Drechslerella dactyloides]|uniref:Uncharacterized protein n=1 Tax=Drechslerella dactyloides TaxID=74499 RepID=A0AAD6IU36_DREDA|nr:hypothetical protein Dda_6387 [Drechslerella dactyloides]
MGAIADSAGEDSNCGTLNFFYYVSSKKWYCILYSKRGLSDPNDQMEGGAFVSYAYEQMPQLKPAAALAATLWTFLVQAAPSPEGPLVKRVDTPAGYKAIPSLSDVTWALARMPVTANGWIKPNPKPSNIDCDITVTVADCAIKCNGNDACKTFNHFISKNKFYCCLYSQNGRTYTSTPDDSYKKVSDSYVFEKTLATKFTGYELESSLNSGNRRPKPSGANGFIGTTDENADKTVVTTAGCMALCDKNRDCLITGTVYGFRKFPKVDGFTAIYMGDGSRMTPDGDGAIKGFTKQYGEEDDRGIKNTNGNPIGKNNMLAALKICTDFCITQNNYNYYNPTGRKYVPCCGFNIWQCYDGDTFNGWCCTAWWSLYDTLKPPKRDYHDGTSDANTVENKESYFYNYKGDTDISSQNKNNGKLSTSIIMDYSG